MNLTQAKKKHLSELIEHKMRMMLDWTDFIEEAGIPLHILDGYLKGKREWIPEEHLRGLAAALGMSYIDLLYKSGMIGETEYSMSTVPDTSNVPPNPEPSSLEKGAALERQCIDLLMRGNIQEFENPYNALWDLFEENHNANERLTLAARIAGLTYQLGEYHHSRSQFIDVCAAYNAAHSLSTSIPESPEAALACVKLAVGVFELKFRFQEFDNVESYIDELIPITAGFHDNEDFSLQGAACLCNLLQLCPYDMGVFADRMIEILHRIEELARRFPQNAALQLCCLHSLVFFLCYGKPRLKDEIYKQYYERTKSAFTELHGIVAERDLADARYSLRQSGIFI